MAADRRSTDATNGSVTWGRYTNRCAANSSSDRGTVPGELDHPAFAIGDDGGERIDGRDEGFPIVDHSLVVERDVVARLDLPGSHQ